MAWSLKGADNMAAMRAVKANGESVHEHYLSAQVPAPVIVELNREVKRELKRLKKKHLLGKEYINNIPLFNGGSNPTRRVLKGLKNQMVV